MRSDGYDQGRTNRGSKTLEDAGRESIQEKQHVQSPWGREDIGLLSERTEIRPVCLGHMGERERGTR